MQTTLYELKNKFPDLITQILGDEHYKISALGSLKNSSAKDILFIFKLEDVERALSSNAGAIVVPAKFSLTTKTNKPIALSPNPELAMAKIVGTFFAPAALTTCKANSGIHKSAVIGTNTKIGKNVSIGAYTVLGDNVCVGDNTQISANCVIEDNVVIGNNVQIFPLVFIGRDCQLGDNCVIQSHVAVGSLGFGYAHDKQGNHYHKPHIGRVILGNYVEVGAGTMIDRGTIDDSIIGDGTKIDNLCHFGHNAKIGKNCLITANFISAGSATIGNNFVCGGRTTIAGHLEVGDNVTIAAHSTVGKSHNEAGAFGGYPLVPLETYKRNLSTTAYLAEMRKNINRLIKKVFPEEK